MAGTIDQLIVNGPYDEPERHWRYDREWTWAASKVPSDLPDLIRAAAR